MTESEKIDEYIVQHIDRESDYMHSLWRATQLHLLYGRMASGHIQGRLLKMLVTMIRPKMVLELGTYSGYSGLCIAEGLEEGAHLHTVEINDEQEDFTLPWFQRSPYADKITMHIGDAMDIVPRLGLTFDMAFIDADKRRYVEYYEMVLHHLAQEAISWPTTHCGTGMWWRKTCTMRRRSASWPSTIWWRRTREWRRSSCRSGTD